MGSLGSESGSCGICRGSKRKSGDLVGVGLAGRYVPSPHDEGRWVQLPIRRSISFSWLYLCGRALSWSEFGSGRTVENVRQWLLATVQGQAMVLG